MTGPTELITPALSALRLEQAINLLEISITIFKEYFFNDIQGGVNNNARFLSPLGEKTSIVGIIILRKITSFISTKIVEVNFLTSHKKLDCWEVNYRVFQSIF